MSGIPGLDVTDFQKVSDGQEVFVVLGNLRNDATGTTEPVGVLLKVPAGADFSVGKDELGFFNPDPQPDTPMPVMAQMKMSELLKIYPPSADVVVLDYRKAPSVQEQEDVRIQGLQSGQLAISADAQSNVQIYKNLGDMMQSQAANQNSPETPAPSGKPVLWELNGF